MDVVTAVSGSSPAYVFLFIEAMADAAVAGGMARSQAYKFAARQFWAALKWFSIQESIRESLRIWSALRRELPLRQCGYWRKKIPQCCL